MRAAVDGAKATGEEKKKEDKKTVAGDAVNFVLAEWLVSCAAMSPLEAEDQLLFPTFFVLKWEAVNISIASNLLWLHTNIIGWP